MEERRCPADPICYLLVGAKLNDGGSYAEAEKMYLAALQLVEGTLGKEHLTAASLTQLGNVRIALGKHEEAKAVLLKAFEIWAGTRGDPFLAPRALNGLALIYLAQGSAEHAETFAQQALEIAEKHPRYATNIADSLTTLARIYQYQGKLVDAETSYNRSLAKLEESVGPKHADTGLTLTGLALLYSGHGRYSEAEPLFPLCQDRCRMREQMDSGARERKRK